MYVELRCKTNFSFLEGASHPHEYIERAHALGFSALAITDRNGVYGLPKAFWRSKDFPGFKLIAGAELTLELSDQQIGSVTLLAQSRAAYGRLCRLLTAAHAGRPKGEARLRLSEVYERNVSGLWAIADADLDWPWGEMSEHFQGQLCVARSRFLDGLDLQRQEKTDSICRRYNIDAVATNDVLYHSPLRRPLQDALSSIRIGKPLHEAGFELRGNAERFLKSAHEMAELMCDQSKALKKTLEIAESCQFSMSELRYRYPSEWIPEQHTAQSYLEILCRAGAQKRYVSGIPGDVQSQLEYELELIGRLGYADYFLTIYDIVSFAQSKNILCQGRGSAANSVVCYCLGITAIDPVRMKLLFERFISAERNEPPDIDVDFEHERREEVIQYIYNKYGRDRAAMVSAVVTYQPRSVFRELAKALGVQVGTLSSKALLRDFQQYAQTSPIPDCQKHVETLADEMEGFPRHLSIHSGGFTLSADPMVDIVPIEPARMEGRTIIQWDKYDLDYLGLLKIDVLSLGMLSALKRTLDLTPFTLATIPAEDPKTYRMIQHADTVGTFQVESRAQMNMSGRLQPRTYYDLVVQVAIVRPGPIVGKMVHPYLRRRQGLETIEYPHPKLREILGRTLGVPLFQEQLMKIAIELGGFTPGESDELRRAIGAWRSSGSIQKVAERLLRGLRTHGIPDQYAEEILEHMKGFAHYGFPESHAASFALLSYASCYLKCHFPAEFACGLLNAQPMGFYAPHTIIDDAKRHGVKVLPVDLTQSHWESTLEQGAIRLGLHQVRGLSKKSADLMIQWIRERRDAQESITPQALLRDVPIQTNVMTHLVLAGAFQGMGMESAHTRNTLWSILGSCIKQPSEQLDLFAGQEISSHRSKVTLPAMTPLERIQQDYRTYDLSPRDHPMAILRADPHTKKAIPRYTTRDVKRQAPQTIVQTAGLVLVKQRPPTANGVTFAAIEDEHGILDVVLFAKQYETYRDIFQYDCFLRLTGRVERDGHSVSLVVQRVASLWPDGSPIEINPRQYF